MSLKGFLIISITTIGIVSGCSKLTAKDYQQISAGMAYAEIKHILDAPEHCTNETNIKQCRWGDENKNIKITFVDNKATSITQKNLK